jgi:hypothetical protein
VWIWVIAKPALSISGREEHFQEVRTDSLKDGRQGCGQAEIDRVPRKHMKRVPMANKRMSKRIKMVLPVKILIDNVTHLAHTLDITSIGGCLGALRTQLKPGAIISLQRGSTKADFRVRWSRQLGPNELQAGIESLQPHKNFWGVGLPDEFEAKEDKQILLDVRSHHSKSVM